MIEVGVLESAHVRLLPMALAHVDALTAAATADRRTFELAPIPRDRGEAQRYVERALADQRADRVVPFVVEHAGAIVGSYRFMALEWWTWPEGPVRAAGEPRVVGRDPPDVAEIGHVWLVPSLQRTKVNSAVCLLMMQHAFEVWRLNRLFLKTDARNVRSRDFIVRLGCKEEGILRQHQPAADGIIRDTAMFSMLPGEWPAAKARLEAAVAR